jgi:hypothetical protein
MGTRLDIKELREYLIDVYERFLSGENIQEEAKKAFHDYMGSGKFISEGMEKAISYLEDIGWNISPKVSHLSKPPKEFALDILNHLKKEESNPPKEWFKKVYSEDKKGKRKN